MLVILSTYFRVLSVVVMLQKLKGTQHSVLRNERGTVQMRMKLVVCIVLVAAFQLAPATASAAACQMCRYLPAMMQIWCVPTDCDASENCYTNQSHTDCIEMYFCDGPLPKWECEMVEGTPESQSIKAGKAPLCEAPDSLITIEDFLASAGDPD